MLAQNFKPPAALGLKDEWFEALVKTLGMLERGELTHVYTGNMKPRRGARATPIAGLFNMNRWSVEFECGTVCCLAGTAEAIGKFEFEDIPLELVRLFYPICTLGTLERTTTEQAAMALRNYLTLGESRWEEVFSDK